MEQGFWTSGRNNLDGGIMLGSELGADWLRFPSWVKHDAISKWEARPVGSSPVCWVQVLHRMASAGHGPPQFGRDVRLAGLDDLDQMEVTFFKVDSMVKLRFKLLFQCMSIDFRLFLRLFQSISIHFNLHKSTLIYFRYPKNKPPIFPWLVSHHARPVPRKTGPARPQPRGPPGPLRRGRRRRTRGPDGWNMGKPLWRMGEIINWCRISQPFRYPDLFFEDVRSELELQSFPTIWSRWLYYAITHSQAEQ